MTDLHTFNQGLAAIERLWNGKDYDQAFAEVESMLESWPGNAHLHILWAGLVQLQDDPTHGLDEAKQMLQDAVELDNGSAAAVIELGHFLDNVEDDPQGAAKAFADGVAMARTLLIEGLIGQAKAFRQLEEKDEFRRCLLEVLYLVRFEANGAKGSHAEAVLELVRDMASDH
jgi:hypothetical protein